MIQPDAAPPIRKLDALDLRLLDELRRNARTSAEELSRVLALSRPAVRDRMRRLERLGILVGYTIVVDWEALGYPILAFIWVRTGSGNCDEHARSVMALSNDAAVVDECHRVTGEWCLLVKVHARTSRDLADLLDAIRESPQVSATATTLALSTDRRSDFRTA
ncbi:MAG: Lrp/AsnC family transcriptional regulator [bacterium]|nr:Lrp/AsnC family transcriptional regulator [bacterium]